MSYSSSACYTGIPPAASSFLAQGGHRSQTFLFFDYPCCFIFIIINKSPFLKLMKSLSRYDEREDPVVLRKDFVKEHAGVGYYGAKMKTP